MIRASTSSARGLAAADAPGTRTGAGTWPWLLLLLVVVAYAVFAGSELALPGIYFDSVNPDYLSAWLRRGALPMPAWIYPDNLLAGHYRFPLLNSLYGGNTPAYLELLFFAVVGYGVLALRMAHALLGLAVLLTFWWALRQWRVPAVIAAGALVALALDPTFVFSWRTQHYLQLFPLLSFAAGVGLLGRHWHAEDAGPRSRKTLRWAGGLLGFAAYGYFVFAFYAAAVIATYLLARAWPRREWRAVAVPLLAGALIGWSPFVYAHLCMLVYLGPHGYLEELTRLQSTYGVIDKEQGGLAGRIAVVVERLAFLVRGSSLTGLVFATPVPWTAGTRWMAGLLAGMPVLAVAALLVRRRAQGTLARGWVLLTAMLAAAACSHLVLGLIVGKPLGLQHYVMLLAPVYVLGFLAILLLFLPWFEDPQRSWQLPSAVVAACALVLAGLNATASAGFVQKLKDTGGAGLYSDAINVMAANLATLPQGTVLLFPQWGYWMGAVTALGPRYAVQEAPDLAAMQRRLRDDPGLKTQRRLALVVGQELTAKGKDAALAAVDAFAREAGLRVEGVVPCVGRNGGDLVLVVKLARDAG